MANSTRDHRRVFDGVRHRQREGPNTGPATLNSVQELIARLALSVSNWRTTPSERRAVRLTRHSIHNEPAASRSATANMMAARYSPPSRPRHTALVVQPGRPRAARGDERSFHRTKRDTTATRLSTRLDLQRRQEQGQARPVIGHATDGRRRLHECFAPRTTIHRLRVVVVHRRRRHDSRCMTHGQSPIAINHSAS